MFVVSNIVGSTIQITTLPLPVLSTLQAVSIHLALAWLTRSREGRGKEADTASLDSSLIPSLLH